MPKIFNVAAVCLPDIHYMVDISDRLCAIKKMVDRRDYFTINRARQYGKTTTMYAFQIFKKRNIRLYIWIFNCWERRIMLVNLPL